MRPGVEYITVDGIDSIDECANGGVSCLCNPANLPTYVSAGVNWENPCHCAFTAEQHTTLRQAEECGDRRHANREPHFDTVVERDDGHNFAYRVLKVNPVGTTIEPFLDVYAPHHEVCEACCPDCDETGGLCLRCDA